MRHLGSLATVALALMVGLIIGGAINSAAANAAAAEVYSVCNSARQELSGASEQKCGDLQTRYNIEFLCNANNASADTHCWTEIK